MNLPSHVQHNAHLSDSRAAIGKRHLLYDLERHPLEACPLTQLFTTLAKRRPSWWSASQADDHAAKSASAAQASQSVVAPSPTLANTTSVTNARSASPASQVNDNASTTDPSDGPPSDEQELPPIPDTIVWENNIPKGWFYHDAKEGHVLRRKVETKAIMSAFLKNAKYADDVVAVMYTSVGQCDTGEPALEYHFISAAGLESFLFENGRGKGTSILQAFVPSLHAAHNDTIEAIWSPTMFHVYRRQNIHEIADDRVELNDRCITFEGKTHLSRLVQCTSRLRQSVKSAVVNFVKHFHETDSKHVITRFVGRFKMNQDSQLIFLNCVSVRIMRAATPSHLGSAGAKAMSESPSRAPHRGLSGDRGNLTFDSGVRAPYTLAAPDGGGSAFYKQYRVCLDLAVHYERRKPPSVAREHRSVLARLQESAEAEREAERRKREEARGSIGATTGTQPPQPDGAMRSKSSMGLHRTMTGIDPDEWMDRAAGVDSSSPTKSRVSTPSVRKAEPMLGTHKASRHGFVVRPNRQESVLTSPLTGSSKHDSFMSSFPPNQQGNRTVDSAVTALVRSGEFANVVTATAEQQQRVCRVLDKCVRKAGVSNVRRALLQAHEDDLTDAERMELLALMLSTDEARVFRAAPVSPGLRSGNEARMQALSTTVDCWDTVRGALDDVGYQLTSALDGSIATVTFPRCPSTSAAARILDDIARHLQSRRASAVLDSSNSSAEPAPAAAPVDTVTWTAQVKEMLLAQFEDDSQRFASAAEVAAVVVGVCLIVSPSCASLVHRCTMHRDDNTVTLRVDLGAPAIPSVRKMPVTASQVGQRVVFASKAFVDSVRHIELRLEEGTAQEAPHSHNGPETVAAPPPAPATATTAKEENPPSNAQLLNAVAATAPAATSPVVTASASPAVGVVEASAAEEKEEAADSTPQEKEGPAKMEDGTSPVVSQGAEVAPVLGGAEEQAPPENAVRSVEAEAVAEAPASPASALDESAHAYDTDEFESEGQSSP